MDPLILILLPNALFWLAATLRFYLIRDVGETSLRLQQSQTHTYISMFVLTSLAIAQIWAPYHRIGISITVAVQ